MRVRFFPCVRQGLPVLCMGFIILVFAGCRRSQEDIQVVPPATHPLARNYLGYGVVNISFAHLSGEPVPGSVSHGYLRRGTVVRIIERRLISGKTYSESWVLVEGNYQSDTRETVDLSQGWLVETSLNIFDNESKAKTAAKSVSQ